MRMVLLVLLLGGIVWCATTEQGRLTSIKAGAALHIYPPALQLDLQALDNTLPQSAVQPEFSGVPLQCAPEKEAILGDAACYSTISLLNDIPAYSAAFFFRHQRLSAVRLALQPASRPRLEQYLQTQFATAEKHTIPARSGNEKPIDTFLLPKGILMTSEEHTDLDELILMWMPPGQGF